MFMSRKERIAHFVRADNINFTVAPRPYVLPTAGLNLHSMPLGMHGILACVWFANSRRHGRDVRCSQAHGTISQAYLILQVFIAMLGPCSARITEAILRWSVTGYRGALGQVGKHLLVGLTNNLRVESLVPYAEKSFKSCQFDLPSA